ncbi:MAG: glycosyltransferase family 4 protein [Clostridia bacterium]|nr:glycosyltransferase family 4 protein [Clostridia bacterium]
MNILIVCQYYWPENFQVTPIAEELAARGHKVTVLTGLPNYPTGVVPEEYRRGHRDETVNGVHIVRCFEAGRGKGAVRLAWNYLSFLLSSVRKARTLEGPFDVVLCYQLSPVLMGIPAKQIAKRMNVPFLVYCCDLWPESLKMYVKSESNPLFRIVKNISGGVYRAADRIICQSESFRSYFMRVHGIPAERLCHIPAFADPKYLEEDFRTDNGVTDFVFLGNLGHAQDLTRMLEAVERIRDCKGFAVHFVGDGACLEELKRLTKEKGLGDIVRFYGRRPVEEMPDFYRLADACLVSLKADNETGYTLPSKVQGYMAAGLPVFGMIEGSAAKAVEDAKCGKCVPSGDAEGFAEVLRDFIEHPGKYADCGANARAYFKENYTKERCIGALEAELMQLVRK